MKRLIVRSTTNGAQISSLKHIFNKIEMNVIQLPPYVAIIFFQDWVPIRDFCLLKSACSDKKLRLKLDHLLTVTPINKTCGLVKVSVKSPLLGQSVTRNVLSLIDYWRLSKRINSSNMLLSSTQKPQSVTYICSPNATMMEMAIALVILNLVTLF